MIEIVGDLWKVPADARCVTTNGVWSGPRRAPRAVMGGGCARQAAERYPNLERDLGDHLRTNGNHVAVFRYGEEYILNFPTKTHYRNQSSLALIERSAWELMEFTGVFTTIVLPRPGVGLGRLLWADVRPVLADIFDDHIHVITWEQHRVQHAAV